MSCWYILCRKIKGYVVIYLVEVTSVRLVLAGGRYNGQRPVVRMSLTKETNIDDPIPSSWSHNTQSIPASQPIYHSGTSSIYSYYYLTVVSAAAGIPCRCSMLLVSMLATKMSCFVLLLSLLLLIF